MTFNTVMPTALYGMTGASAEPDSNGRIQMPYWLNLLHRLLQGSYLGIQFIAAYGPQVPLVKALALSAALWDSGVLCQYVSSALVEFQSLIMCCECRSQHR